MLSYTRLANIAAYAQLYDLLPFVAGALRAHLLRRGDIWEDVRDYPEFHFALAIKLRCSEIYCDALRHLIGSGRDLTFLATKLDFDADTLLKFMLKRETLRSHTDQLSRDVQALTLHTYIPHTDREEHGEPVKTTYLSSTFETFDNFHKCGGVARRIMAEFLILHLSGKEHWSHVRHADQGGAGQDGMFYQR